MTDRDELIVIAAAAMSPTLSERARHTWATRIVDAIEPIIRGAEIAKYDAVWRGAHEQYRRELRAAIEALPTIRYRTGTEPNVDAFAFAVDLQSVLDLIDGGTDD